MYLSAQTSPEWTSGNAKKWMKSAVWSNGWTVSPHKSVNAVEFACQYHKNKDVWDAAFRFLAEHDWKRCPLATMSFWRGNAGLRSVNTFPKRWRKGILKVTSVLSTFSMYSGEMKRWGWQVTSKYVRRIIQKGCCFLYLFPDKTLLCRCRQFLLVFPFGHSPAFCSGKGGTC